MVYRRDDAVTWLSFFALWLGGTWPYQAVLQAQSYYVDALGATWLVPTLLVIYTWGLLLFFVAQLSLGMERLLSVPARIYTSFALTGSLGVVFVVQDLLPISATAHEVAMMGIALAMAAEQILLEPTLYGLAGMMSEAVARPASEPDADGSLSAEATRGVHGDGPVPSSPLPPQPHQLGGGGLQAMLVGNGSAGVVVVAIGAALRVGAGGADLSVAGLRRVTRIFWAILVFISIACALIFAYFRRTVAGVEPAIVAMGADGAAAARAAGERVRCAQRRRGGFDALEDTAAEAACVVAGSERSASADAARAAAPPASRDAAVGARGAAKEGAAARLRRLRAVAVAVAAPAASQFLVYAVTLAAWPSIPGRARFAPSSVWGAPALAPYWFTFVLAAFNATDCAARLGRSALERLASRLPPCVFVAACVARCALLALVYAAALAPGAIGLGAAAPSGGAAANASRVGMGAPGERDGACANVVGSDASGAAILLATVALAASNGLIATATMMQAPKLVPPALRDTASFVLVVALYAGLAVGASAANVVVLALPDTSKC